MKPVSSFPRLIGAAASLASLSMWLFPAATQAFVPSKWEGRYEGDWVLEQASDACSFGPPETGTIVIRIVDMKKDGTITDARIKFSDEPGTPAELGTGRVFYRDGVRRIRLNYDITGYDRYIKGRLTDKKRIKGHYFHSDTYGCSWSGSVNAKRI